MTYDDVQRMVIEQNGFRNWYGTLKSPNQLANEELQVVTTGVAAYIVAHPDEFSPASVAIAKGRINFSNGSDYALQDNSLGANIGVFVDAYGQEVKKAANVGGKTLQNAIYIAAAVGAVALVWRFFGTRKASK